LKGIGLGVPGVFEGMGFRGPGIERNRVRVSRY
jgi:hypothetical protein